MKPYVFCKTIDKGVQAFFVHHNNTDYFLFCQKYYIGVRNYFRKGVFVDKLSTAGRNCNTAVRRTATKIPTYLKNIEHEYDVEINKKKDNICFKRNMYKNEYFYTEDNYVESI